MKPGTVWIFDYPSHFVTLPEYTAHAGQHVTIVRELAEGSEYDNPGIVNEGADSDRMFRVRAADGWEGDAWESELNRLPE